MREIALPHVLSQSERHDQMQQAINRGLPFVKKRGAFLTQKASVVCFGPSLRDTWKSVTRPIITVSGAHDFLVERGITPNWHVEMDPRPHKPQMLRRPQKETKYLMASVCHPDFWDILEGYDVELWHLVPRDHKQTIGWVADHHPTGTESLIGGGSTVGQRAFSVAASVLGFRRFNVFGMDCSFGDTRHAGEHTGEPQIVVRAGVAGREFTTTPQLLQAAQEMQEFLQTTDAEFTFFGDGLLQEVARILRSKRR